MIFEHHFQIGLNHTGLQSCHISDLQRWNLTPQRELDALILVLLQKILSSSNLRWVQRYAPEIDKHSRPYLKQTNDSWRVNETYIKVRGQWMYLY